MTPPGDLIPRVMSGPDPHEGNGSPLPAPSFGLILILLTEAASASPVCSVWIYCLLHWTGKKALRLCPAPWLTS